MTKNKEPNWISPLPGNIPDELKYLDKWVLWRATYDPDREKWTKPPYQTNGRFASHSNQETWTSFDRAVNALQNGGQFTGIGFVLSEKDPFTGIDLDHCRNPEDGALTSEAWSIIKRMDSYAEVSPSGTGVRIFVKGKLPPGGRKNPKKGIEVYDDTRYLTLTGKRINDNAIEQRQDELESFHKEVFCGPSPNSPTVENQTTETYYELLQKAFESANGSEVRALYLGDISGYESQSEADLDLCKYLAFWFERDAGKVDAVFRQSGLYRQKWDDKHYADGRTYGQATIQRGIAGCKETRQEWLGRNRKTSGKDQGEQSKTRSDTEQSQEGSPEEKPAEKTKWDFARELFPKQAFPWEILPPKIVDSLKQLARSCATSPTSLPGVAIAILASAFGRTVMVSPKSSWKEPLIFWMMDIRKSGDGKTPAAKMLTRKLDDFQGAAEEDYKRRLEEWREKNTKERGPEPARARGYLITQLTLEGVRADMETNPHGGVICIMSELSAFISGQNQYKKKGDDRESWLCLHDGLSARVVRASKAVYIKGARVSVFGGIQPAVWKQAFSSDDGVYLEDGTLFRFLPTFEPSKYHELTPESWSEENRGVWERTLVAAMRWSDERARGETWKPKDLHLTEEAQIRFYEWRNDLELGKPDIPGEIQGFLPKIYGYALRFAGALYCLHAFHSGEELKAFLDASDVERGIRAVEFYMGHIVDAMCALCGDILEPGIVVDDRVLHLARTLESLRSEIDSGKLAVGYIFDRYNQDCKPENKMKSARAMGGLIRDCGLNILPGNHDANGKRSAKCLLWDKKTKQFIETSLQSLQSLHDTENTTVINKDIEKTKSAKSAIAAAGMYEIQTLQTLKNQSLQENIQQNQGRTDIADIADFCGDKTRKNTVRI